jgi:predicted deacetylase
MMRKRRLVVSIHDVAPPTFEPTKEILAQLNSAGVDRVSLLVIPNYRGQWRLDEHADFAAWLRERVGVGDEMVLHGYEHAEVKPARGMRDKLKNRLYTVGEGEFLSLSYEEARQRLQRGLAIFGKIGVPTRGFVAPSWLLSQQGLAAARDLGFEYTNYYLQFSDLSRGKTAFAPSLVFGPGNLNEDWALRAQRFVRKLLNRCSLVRIVIHPPCVENARRFSQTLQLIREQVDRHRPSTYQEFLADWREQETSPFRTRGHEAV